MRKVIFALLITGITCFMCSSNQPPDFIRLVDTGSLDSARVLIEDALAANPQDAAALAALVKLYYFRGDYDRCKAAYEKLPDKAAAPYAAHLYRAFCHDRYREYDKAAAAFGLAIAAHPRLSTSPDDTLGHSARIRYYIDQNSRTLNVLARNILTHALEKHPARVSLLLLQAEALLQHYTLHGRTDVDYLAEAEKIVRKIKMEKPARPATLLLLARLAENVSDADGYYRAAIDADRKYTPALCAHGDHLLKFGAPDKAGEKYDAALQADSSQIKGYLGKGFVALKKDSAATALRHFRRARAIDNESPVVWYNLGVAYGQLKRANDAIDAYQAALVRNPQMVDALYNLGRMYYLSYKYNQAKVVLERAIELAPSFSDAYIMQGNTFLKLGEREKARAVLQAVLLKDPDNELAKQNLFKMGYSEPPGE